MCNNSRMLLNETTCRNIQKVSWVNNPLPVHSSKKLCEKLAHITDPNSSYGEIKRAKRSALWAGWGAEVNVESVSF